MQICAAKASCFRVKRCLARAQLSHRYSSRASVGHWGLLIWTLPELESEVDAHLEVLRWPRSLRRHMLIATDTSGGAAQPPEYVDFSRTLEASLRPSLFRLAKSFNILWRRFTAVPQTALGRRSVRCALDEAAGRSICSRTTMPDRQAKWNTSRCLFRSPVATPTSVMLSTSCGWPTGAT